MQYVAGSDLSAWDLIQELTAFEAASLIVGSDPARSDIPDAEAAKARVIERAIRDAVKRAAHLAWLRLDDRLPEEMPITPDIWEMEDDYSSYLPTSELRESASAVLADPENAAVLLEIDPWYSATVYVGDFRDWLERNNVQPAYEFKDGQYIVVTKQDEQAMREWYLEMASANNKSLPHDGRESSDEKTQDKPIAPRERTTLLNIIGALRELVLSPRKGRDTDAALIRELLDNYSDVPGISERNLQAKFADSKRSLRTATEHSGSS